MLHYAKRAAQYSIVFYTLLVVVHVNLDVYYEERRGDHLPGGALMEPGFCLGLGPKWRMYSPVPRELHQIQWFAQNPSGEWVDLDLPNLGRAHRERQGFLHRWFLDFKTARLWDSTFIYYGREDPRRQQIFVSYHRRRLEEQLGWLPSQIHVVVRKEPIPSPADKGSWTPHEASFHRVFYDVLYR